MAFLIYKVVDGAPMWFKRASPMVTWGPRPQATLFKTKGDARRAVSGLSAKEQPVTIVEDRLPLD
jgi:hypothetical protein